MMNPSISTQTFSRSISTFTFRNKNTGLTNRCLHRHSHVHIQKQKHWTPNRCLKLTIHRTEPYSLMSLLYFCGHLEYIPGAHLEPCRELFSFQLFTQKKLHHRYHNRLGSQYASVNWTHKFSALISHSWTRDCLIGLTDN